MVVTRRRLNLPDEELVFFFLHCFLPCLDIEMLLIFTFCRLVIGSRVVFMFMLTIFGDATLFESGFEQPFWDL